MEANESMLISGEENQFLEEKFVGLELSEDVQQPTKTHGMLQSINCSSVNHKFLDESSSSSFITKINYGMLTEDQISDLKGKHMKVKYKYFKLCQDHQLLKSKCQRYETTRNNRMTSSARHINPKIPLQTSKRKMVSLRKNCQLAQSVHHPVTLSFFESKNLEDYLPPLLKETKNVLLFQEATKLQDLFNTIKMDISYFEEWVRKVSDDREGMIIMLDLFLNEFFRKVQTIEEDFYVYSSKVEEYISQAKRTSDAFETYRRNSAELIDYYKKKQEKQRNSKTKSSGNRFRSGGQISENDTTLLFRNIIATTYIDFPETQTSLLVQKVVNQEMQELQYISEGRQQSLIRQIKKKLEQYVRSIYSIKQMIEGNSIQHSYLDNNTVRQWMSVIKANLVKFNKVKNIFKQERSQHLDHKAIETSFTQNIAQLSESIEKNNKSYLQKIKQLSKSHNDHGLFFAHSAYSTFSKTLVTNLINVQEYITQAHQSIKISKICIDAMDSFKVMLERMIGQRSPTFKKTLELILSEEHFLLKLLDHIQNSKSTMLQLFQLLN